MLSLCDKIAFLEALRTRVREVIMKQQPMTLSEVVKQVFLDETTVNQISMSEGWMSVITGGDFSRSNLIRTFVDEAVMSRVKSDDRR